MIRAHVIRLDPTHKQDEFFRQCVGTARFAYNWALGEWRRQYAAGEKPNVLPLLRQLNAIKREQFPWMLDTPKTVPQQAIKNLGTAYKNFFDSLKGKRKGPKMESPDFKEKGKCRESARLDNGPGTFHVKGRYVKLPVIGTVKTFEELRFAGRPMSATLSHQGGRWWISIQVEMPDEPKRVDPSNAVGVDFGLTSALTLSTGEKIVSPKPLRAALEKLAHLQRKVSRRVKKSANRLRAIRQLNIAHWRVAQIRKDWQHKVTTAIAKRFSVVCVEDLNVKGMLANHKLARSIADIGWGEISRQLKYKCAAVREVGRFYPSSKLCHDCGAKAEAMPLNVREWACRACGCIHDRDVNASLNIRSEGLRLFTASYAGINACGDGSSGCARKRATKLPSTKQESQQCCKAHREQQRMPCVGP